MDCVESKTDTEDVSSSPSSLLTKTSETYEGSGDSSFELQEENSTPEKNIGVRKYRPKRLPGASDNSSESDCRSSSFINMDSVSFLRTPDGANVDRFVTDESLLDSLFDSCDMTKSGMVRPHHLVNCVHSVFMPMYHDDETRFMEGLNHLLDPEGRDEEVNLYTFTNAFDQWITKYQLENMNNTVFLDKSVSSSLRPASEDDAVPQWCSSRRIRHQSSVLDASMFSYGSLEGNGGDMSLLEGESTDLYNKIDDLNFQIRKLTEQNSKLKSELEVTEETNSQLLLDLDTSKQQIKGSQVISQRNLCVREENQELKTTLTTTEDAKKEIQTKYEQLDYERGILETRVTNLEDELSQTQDDLEQITRQKNDGDKALKDYKDMFKAIQEQLATNEMELSERVQRCVDLEKLLMEEQKQKDTLKTEKVQLENQILETRQELMVFQSQEHIVEEFNERDILTPTSTSTPQKGMVATPRSLHSELKCLVNQESNLPSPLCGTSLLEIGKDDETLFSVGDEKLNNLTYELKVKRDTIKRQIHEIIMQKALASQHAGYKSKQVKSEDNLYAEMDSLLEYVTAFANEKSESERRIAKLRHIIKKLRDENSKMVKKQAETLLLLQKQPESQPDTEEVRQENERLTSALLNANNINQILEEKMDKCKAELDSMQDEAQTAAHALQQDLQHKKQLEIQLEQKNNAINKLEDDLKVKEEYIVKLELEINQTDEELQESRKHFYNLENSLALTMSEHNTDLKGIMSLVSCSDCSSNESQDFVDQLQGQSVKDKVGRQLSDLQTQLAKQKSKIASLETFRSDQTQQFQNVTDLEKNTKNTLLNETYSTSLFSALSLELDKRLLTKPSLHNTSHDLLSSYLDKTSSISTQTELPRTPTHESRWNNCVQTNVVDAHSTPARLPCQCSQHAIPVCINGLQTIARVSGEDSDSSCESVFYSAIPSPEPYSLCASREHSPAHTPTILHSEDSINQPLRFVSQSEEAMQPQNIAESLDENCNNDVRSPFQQNITFWHTKSSHDRQAEAQKMADMLANSYATPSQQVASEILSSQTDEDGCAMTVPSKKLSPRPKRRIQTDRNRRTVPVNVSDLLNGNVDNVELSETDKELNSKLIEESRRASERFKNRKGRRTAGGLTGHSNRSRSLSPRNINSEDEIECDRETNGSFILLQVPTFAKRTSPATKVQQNPPQPSSGDTQPELQQEEDENMQSSDDQMETIEADIDVDIKADILKGIGPIEPDQAKSSAQLSQLRKVNKLKRGTPLFKMPELAEASETESAREAESPCESDASMLELLVAENNEMCENELQESHDKTLEEMKADDVSEHVEITKDAESENEKKDEVIVPKEQVEEIVKDDENGEATNEETDNKQAKTVKRLSALLPESVLRSLGLSKTKDEPTVLTEKEVEDKFMNLSLALKTDKYTLDKRVYLYERQRNLAEANIDEELQELHKIIHTLDPLCKDLEAKDCLNKIRSHLEFLNSSSHRLCSKAELLGAAHQENRLSVAADVMVTHVENLKKMYEKEHSELEDAKKLLEENKLLFRGNTPGGLANDAEEKQDSRLVTRRSLSSVGNPKIRSKVRLSRCRSESDKEIVGCDEGGRRRASVATFIGYSNTSNQGGQHEISHGRYTTVRRSSIPHLIPLATNTHEEDARSRFSSAIAATAARNKLGTMFLAPKPDGSPEIAQLSTTPAKRKSQVSFSDESPTQKDLLIVEEQSYNKGFEEGVRVQLSQELLELRKQQKGLCDNLDELMDRAEDEQVKPNESFHVQTNTFLDSLPFDISLPWYQLKRVLRLIFTVVMFIFALLTLIMTILPIESCHGSMAVVQRPGRSIGEFLHQFVELKHSAPPTF